MHICIKIFVIYMNLYRLIIYHVNNFEYCMFNIICQIKIYLVEALLKRLTLF